MYDSMTILMAYFFGATLCTVIGYHRHLWACGSVRPLRRNCGYQACGFSPTTPRKVAQYRCCRPCYIREVAHKTPPPV